MNVVQRNNESAWSDGVEGGSVRRATHRLQLSSLPVRPQPSHFSRVIKIDRGKVETWFHQPFSYHRLTFALFLLFKPSEWPHYFLIELKLSSLLIHDCHLGVKNHAQAPHGTSLNEIRLAICLQSGISSADIPLFNKPCNSAQV